MKINYLPIERYQPEIGQFCWFLRKGLIVKGYYQGMNGQLLYMEEVNDLDNSKKEVSYGDIEWWTPMMPLAIKEAHSEA